MSSSPLAIFRSYVGQLVRSVAMTPRRRRLQELREQWGQDGDKNPWLVSRYFELISAHEDPSAYVDDRTWKDLEFPRLFARMDTTVTPLGSQYLYGQLRLYPREPSLVCAGYETYRELAADRALRERIQLILTYLDADSCAYLAETLFGTPPPTLEHGHLLTFWSALAFLLAAGAAAAPLSIVPFLVVAAVNIAIIGRMSPQANRLTEALVGMYRLTRVGEVLSRIETGKRIPQLQELASTQRARAKLRRAFRPFAVLHKSAVMGIPAWLNILFLWEWLAHMYIYDRLRGMRDELRPLFACVASLDAAIALASYVERLPRHCRPQFTTARDIGIEAGCHPLLATGVANSVSLRGRSALVTGSNMAGKTTFIKMIATNLILGRTIGICVASSALVPLSVVRAFIHSDHSIESGKSHYFSELEAMKSFFDEAIRATPSVLVIDEPFSGTNTVERIAAAKAVLDALSRHSPVLATTHDVELQQLLHERFEMFHFTEDPDVAGFFDFRLRQGTCTERNALRLLEKIGFPQAVTTEAAAFAARFAAAERQLPVSGSNPEGSDDA